MKEASWPISIFCQQSTKASHAITWPASMSPNTPRPRRPSPPFPDKHFDFVFSITTLHNLHNYDLDKALREMERVGKKNKYLCVESYRNEVEKANLLYWQVTCEAFCTPEEWDWWFKQTGYTGDHSFIYFE